MNTPFLDTAFAKVVTDLDGWSSIMIEGSIIRLACDDQLINNQTVDAIVRGLRRADREYDTTAASKANRIAQPAVVSCGLVGDSGSGC